MKIRNTRRNRSRLFPGDNRIATMTPGTYLPEDVSGEHLRVGGKYIGAKFVSPTDEPAPNTAWRIEMGGTEYPLRYWNNTDTRFSLDTDGNIVINGDILDTSGGLIIGRGGFSRVKVKNGGGTNVPDSTNITIEPTNEDVDTDNYWDGSDDYIIVPFTGQYMVLAQLSYAAGSDNTGFVKAWIQNAPSPYGVGDWADLSGGFEAYAKTASSTTRTTVQIADVFDLTALDGLRVRARQENTPADDKGCRMRLAVVFMGPT